MNLGAIVSRARKMTADNTPLILTAIGVSGTVATVLLASKASFKAAEVLNEREKNRWPDDEDLEFKEKLEKTWKLYVPAVVTGTATIACIVSANHISTRRAAALASAYSISQEALREYKGKVLEKLGEKKEQGIRDEIAQDRVNRLPPPPVMIVSNGNVLCLDMHSGRYFDCDMETIRKAENDINYRILHDNYASLSDFWERVGLSKTTESDEIGWNTDKGLEVQYSSVPTDEGKPCLTIEFRTVPIRGYYNQY
jgi:hypothetical protein